MKKLLDRATKVLLLQVLKQRYATDKERAAIVRYFAEPQPVPAYDFVNMLTDDEMALLLKIAEKIEL
jgi:hypothetical protein